LRAQDELLIDLAITHLRAVPDVHSLLFLPNGKR
jgi:hypothetical protein